jgi:carbonic anhydrase
MSMSPSGHALSVHGWIYGLNDGLLKYLKCTSTAPIKQEIGRDELNTMGGV